MKNLRGRKCSLIRKSRNKTRKVLILALENESRHHQENLKVSPQKNLVRVFLKTSSVCDSIKSYSHEEHKEMLVFPDNYSGLNIFYHVSLQLVETPASHDYEDNTENFEQNDLLVQVSKAIKENYDLFEGFVILYPEADINAFSCELSFVMEHLSKPVIFINTDINISMSLHGLHEEIKHAIVIAAAFEIPEMCFFHKKQLFRANRVAKDLNGVFFSPNFPPLGEIVDNDIFEPNWNLIRKTECLGESVETFTGFSRDIAHFVYTPMIESVFLEAIFDSDSVKIILIESYGIGNIPQKNKLLGTLIKKAIDNKKLIYTITQCKKGFVTALYETNYSTLGILPGFDLSAPAAIAKLCYLLGKFSGDLDKVQLFMDLDLRGEVSIKPFNSKTVEKTFRSYFTDFLKLEKSEKNEVFNDLVVEELFLNCVANGKISMLVTLKSQALLSDKLVRSAFEFERNIFHILADKNKDSKGEEVFDFLCKYFSQSEVGQKLDQQDAFGNIPLTYAILGKNKEVMKKMFGATSQSFINPQNEDQVLQRVNDWIKLRDYDGLRGVYFLAAKGESLHNYRGANLAHLAVLNKSPQVLRFMERELDDFDLAHQDQAGLAPIDYAQKIKESECEKILKHKTND